MVDCNHANSGKDPYRQEQVLRAVLHQVNDGRKAILGTMIESNLGGGNQPIGPIWNTAFRLPMLALTGRTPEGSFWMHTKCLKINLIFLFQFLSISEVFFTVNSILPHVIREVLNA